MATKLEKLQTDLDAVDRKIERLTAQKIEAQNKHFDLNRAIHRENLKLHIGDDVRIGCRGYSLDNPWLDDAIGKLVKVNRTRCVVDYGDRGEWTIPIHALKLATEAQRFTVRF